MTKYISYCMADHCGEFSGLFACLRNRLWWLKHEKCRATYYYSKRGSNSDC